jgi:peptidoglycan L-alanyl-D-glutamate endopeptidase CwlK
MAELNKILRELVPALRDKVEDVRVYCAAHRVDLMVYCGRRSAQQQAGLYRQSRTLAEIQKKASDLTKAGHPDLAEILLGVGPQAGTLGKHVTNAGPGESWHQYGEAIDAVPLVDGKPAWDSDHPAWGIYGRACAAHGLVWAGTWKGFKEMPHAQLRQVNNPLAVLSFSDIRDAITWR